MFNTSWTIEDKALMSRILRTITYAARRHRCALCKEVFECHLCGFEDFETHPMHSERARPEDIVCEDCVIKHDLYVRVIGYDGKRYFKASRARNVRQFAIKRLTFYDHITGEYLGCGTLRWH